MPIPVQSINSNYSFRKTFIKEKASLLSGAFLFAVTLLFDLRKGARRARGTTEGTGEKVNMHS